MIGNSNPVRTPWEIIPPASEGFPVKSISIYSHANTNEIDQD